MGGLKAAAALAAAVWAGYGHTTSGRSAYFAAPALLDTGPLQGGNSIVHACVDQMHTCAGLILILSGAGLSEVASGTQSAELVSQWASDISDAVRVSSSRPQSLLVFVNPFGGTRRAAAIWQTVLPVFQLVGEPPADSPLCPPANWCVTQEGQAMTLAGL